MKVTVIERKVIGGVEVTVVGVEVTWVADGVSDCGIGGEEVTVVAGGEIDSGIGGVEVTEVS